MVTMPFFRNLTLQIETFLGYYEKKKKQKQKKASKQTMFLGPKGQVSFSQMKGKIKKDCLPIGS